MRVACKQSEIETLDNVELLTSFVVVLFANENYAPEQDLTDALMLYKDEILRRME
jgi:hypothetical protein